MRNATETFTINNSGTTTSPVIDVSQVMAYSVQAKFSDGTASGSLTTEVSNDPPAVVGGSATPTNWSTDQTKSVSSGALTLVPFTNCGHNWLRVKFVSSGGAGTISGSVKTNGF